jgi:hypothetical protein
VQAVGFAPDSDLLLVMTAGRRAVFDLLSGERVAQDERKAQDDFYDASAEVALGLGPAKGALIQVCGEHGALGATRHRLPVATPDGWTLERTPTGDGRETLTLRCVRVETELCDAYQPRAVGFSPTGNTLVVAEGDRFRVWRAPAD